jgi:acyl-CoA thioesterase-1
MRFLSPRNRFLRGVTGVVVLWVAIVNTTAAVQSNAPVIMILGDSLSTGYGMDVELSWPVVLQERLAAFQYPQRIVNVSVPAETTTSALKRLPELLAKHDPVITIVALGVNDGARRVRTQRIEANLRRILELIRNAGSRSLLIKMQLLKFPTSSYSRTFNTMYEKLIGVANTRLSPYFMKRMETDPGLMQADGLHPNANATPLMLVTVWNDLQSMLGPSPLETQATSP